MNPEIIQKQTNPTVKAPGSNRRSFLGRMTGIATAIGAVGVAGPPTLAAEEIGPLNDRQRRDEAFNKRVNRATAEHDVPLALHPDNGDESRYPTKIGNYSKGLPHNSIGEVDLNAYNTMIHALTTGVPADFELITLGGTVLLVNPQSGLAYDLEGTDIHQFSSGPPPALASAQKAGEAVEDYWMALLRDVNYSQYATDPTAQLAIADLNRLFDFRGPKINGQVTPVTLFRGFTPADLIGPYISQYMYPTIAYGAAQIVQQFQTYPPLSAGGMDYLTDFPSWLKCQNGQGPFGSPVFDSQRRYIRNGRDLSAYVHVDAVYEAYLNACLYLVDNNYPLNPGNPYIGSKTQTGFATFGTAYFKTILAEVTTRSLKGVWFQKWYVHRHLRPEAYCGLVQNTLTGVQTYPLHPDVLKSQAVKQVFQRNQSYLLPIAYPEGSPQHPSYAQGHATLAGACVTILKALFNENTVIANPVVPTGDGLSLVPYTGSDAGQMTVGGEANKLAGNIGLGRDHAGVHWRSDYTDGLTLGEAIAISVLKDQKTTYNEVFQGFTFTKFDGSTITV